jgi:hypothetical protein
LTESGPVLRVIRRFVAGRQAALDVEGLVEFHRRRWQTVLVDDEQLLAEAEQALTEIKVNQGLSDRHASVLVALRIRLKGSAGKSLEEMLAAAGDLKPGLEEELGKADSQRKPSLDDLLSEEKPKPGPTS